MIANNMKELEKLINQKIKRALETEVNDTVRRTLKENVIDEVYDKYEPTQYQRTGGLYQDSNIDSTMENDNTLSVRSVREEDGRDIAEILETGKGYAWKNSEIARSEQPRPFHEITKQEIESKNLHVKAMKEGLKRQGLTIE